MLSYLKGTVLKRNDKGIILSIGQIGYFVHLSKTELATAKESAELELFIHNQIREDGSDLYGFSKYESLEFFKKLISIKGIGPKVAIEILNFPISEISEAIVKEDTNFISKIPGIGKKTAQRLILELKGELTRGTIDREYRNISPEVQSEVEQALQKFGYQKSQIKPVLQKAPDTLTSTEQLISYFLKNA